MKHKILSSAGLALAVWGLPAGAGTNGGTSRGTGDGDVVESVALMQIRVPQRRAAPATQPAEETPATRPAEPYSPPAEMPRLEVPGYEGRGFRETRVVPTDDFIPINDRWRIGIPGDYVQNVRGNIFDPYNQNVLKGDYPIIGDDIFLILTATSDTLLEARKTPIPSAVSSLRPGSLEFFGDGDTQLLVQNFILTFELFKGDAAYKPRDWELRFTPVAQINYVRAEELQVTDPDFQEGRYRNDTWIGIQEAFVEKHLSDLSVNYDFWAVRAGIQGFTSDFRGFLFSDNEPGIRFFGIHDSNQTQWNVAAFYHLEKDTNSGLNSYSVRDQTVLIANLFRQDFLKKGYTAQLSVHANFDEGDFELDENGFLARPQPIGTIKEKDVRAYYLGWAGDGHIGRLNLSHQFYQAFGEETFNQLAGQQVDINAQFFAAELSYDQDYIRYRTSFAYSSGDSDPTDGTGRGFDTIFDNPNFAGGGFSYLTRQAIRLTGSNTGLFQRNSFVPNLRTSKEQGQANFVNPGLFLYNVGMDIETTPRTKVILNASYLQFAETEALELIVFDDNIDNDIGFDLSVGVQYRPFLNNNVIFTGGAAALIPGQGFSDLFTSETLYSVFLGITLTY